MTLPTTAGGLATVPLTLPSDDTAPGPYEVQASLLDTSTVPADDGRDDLHALHGGRRR